MGGAAWGLGRRGGDLEPDGGGASVARGRDWWVRRGQKVAEGFWGKDVQEVEPEGREVGGRRESVWRRGVGAAEKGVEEGGETED